MKMIFFADAHLTRKNKKKIKFVETFVRDVCSDADMVFILGDLFESIPSKLLQEKGNQSIFWKETMSSKWAHSLRPIQGSNVLRT
jgi:UDP-2,3-diacylglucosamine pyrophosphatase LpxH